MESSENVPLKVVPSSDRINDVRFQTQEFSHQTPSRNTKLPLLIFAILIILFVVVLILVNHYFKGEQKPVWPLVINTWPFTNATKAAFQILSSNSTSNYTALDALEWGCNQCENYPEQCDWAIGYGGSPNEDGETTLDAMVMFAPTQEIGAVGCLKKVQNAISVARKVLHSTYHTLLVGDDATRFAISQGFPTRNMSTNGSIELWEQWIENNHQPNFWKGNHNYNGTNYESMEIEKPSQRRVAKYVDRQNHDTIGMVTIDKNGNIACGTSTNGLTYKIPGRVGDSPIMGAGAWCDNEVGGAAATGDGDVMMRFLPTVKAVEYMRGGMSPSDACAEALAPINKLYPGTKGALICVKKNGEHGGAQINWSFTYSIQSGVMEVPKLVNVE